MNKKDLFDVDNVLDIIIPLLLIEGFAILQVLIIGIILCCLKVV